MSHDLLDLLLEMGCEDLPARYIAPLATALSRGLSEGLSKRGLVPDATRTFATPRRIATLVSGLAERQPDQAIERLGPSVSASMKDGKPTPAALGFAKSCGVEFATLGQKDGKLFFSKTAPGRATRELIPEIFEETLKQMDELVPKRMRWGSGEETFVRPVEWLCCLFGGEIVPLRRFGLEAGRVTYGHRFHAPKPIALTSPAAYPDALLRAYVWADVTSRKSEIRKQIEAAAAKLGGHARITEDLLDEVTALVEWPVAIAGKFEERFLELPPEVIVATVETNQRYFTVFKDAALTQLTQHFITISNIESRDVAQVIAGNERVVRPRLTDALFFWQQDLKQPLSDYVAKLDSVTFQKELGSTGAKVHRIAKLALKIAGALDEYAPTIARAADLCKADLVTRMVYEFPELQGVMGGYYAQISGESASVATAIREHYLPTQQCAPIPSTRAGQIVALADKLDTLAGIFAIDQRPTASKDPFALRRAALGVLRIIREAGLKMNWPNLVQDALAFQPTAESQKLKARSYLTSFIEERYRNLCVGSRLSADGPVVTPEQFEAVAARKKELVSAALSIGDESQIKAAEEARINDIGDFEKRLQAVQAFSALPESRDLATANKRVRNIVTQGGAVEVAIDPGRFEHKAEGALFEAMNVLATRNETTADYTAKLVNLASLRAPVDAFFEGVMVNAENPIVRTNRLALLQKLDTMCREVADLSCLPG